MAANIKMTPQDLRDTSEFLKNKRGEIVEAVRNIKTRVDTTCDAWEGAAQNSFVAQFEEMLPMLTESFPQVIEGIESMLTGAADALEQADEEIGNAFKS